MTEIYILINVCTKEALEIPVAIEYYQEDNVCRSCPHFELCREEREILDAKN